jgi:hypothetical protein
MATTIVSFRLPSGQDTSRRALLQGAGHTAGAALALGLPAAIAGEAADPHPAWYAEWRAAIDYMDGPATRGVSVLSDLPIYHRALELEDLIGGTPAQTLAGALCQLRMLRHWCTPASMPNETLDAALGNALATAEQLARESTHV